MIVRVLLYAMASIIVGMGAYIIYQNMVNNSLEETTKEQAQQIVDKDSQIKVIGVNVNSTLERMDNDTKNEIIVNDNTLRTGKRRLR